MTWKNKEDKNRYYRRKDKEFIEFIRTLKQRPCFDCGVSYPHYMMEFDHARGDKIKNICEYKRHSITSSKFLAELEKCDIVCANCHSARTWFRNLERI